MFWFPENTLLLLDAHENAFLELTHIFTGDSPPTGHHREEHTLPLWSQDFEAISGSIVGQDPTSSGLYSHNGPVRPGGNNLPVANERYLPGKLRGGAFCYLEN